MRVWALEVEEKSEWALPVDEGDFEVFRCFDGTSHVSGWNPIRMRLVREDESGVLSEADTPWLGGHVLILKPRALEALGELLAKDGELLPLDCPGTPLYVWNVLNVIDALDGERSEVVRFRSSGHIMTIEKHAFQPEKLAGQRAFKIPPTESKDIFFTDEFVQAAETLELRGLRFRLLWEELP